MTKERQFFGNEIFERGVCGKSFETRELPPEPIHGVLIVDFDGTLTLPGSKYAVDKRAVLAISEFVLRGGVCALNTGATKERMERTFYHPLFCLLDEQCGFDKSVQIYNDRIWLLPENGSAILKSNGVTILENELWFKWDENNPLHVPNKKELRKAIETILVPRIPGSFVVGDNPGEIGRRNYILSWKGLKDAPRLIEMINNEIIPNNSGFDWKKIQMKAARTTIDFINAESGKEQSTRTFLSKLKEPGPIVGFGDLGDEFASVPGVLTFNVNAEKPNSFRRVGLPSLEVTNWVTKNKKDCSMEDVDKILCSNGGGDLILVKDGGEQKIILAEPLTRGAGEATAEILERLMDVGYFRREDE